MISEAGGRSEPRITQIEALGKLVRKRRHELELRIDDAASACGVAANVFSRLENGSSIGVDRLLKVLDGLGLTMLVLTKPEASSVIIPGAVE